MNTYNPRIINFIRGLWFLWFWHVMHRNDFTDWLYIICSLFIYLIPVVLVGVWIVNIVTQTPEERAERERLRKLTRIELAPELKKTR